MAYTYGEYKPSGNDKKKSTMKGYNEGGTTQTVVQQERLPAWIQPYYTHLAEESQRVSASPYQSYGGSRIADFSDAERAAFSGITQLGTSGGPMQQRMATQTLQGGIGGLQGMMPQYQDVYGRAGKPGMTTGADWSAYMDPYTKNVTDIAAREAMRMGDMQRSELGSRAAQSGAFGGYRHGLGEQAVDRGVRQEVSDLRTRGLERAFDRGLGMFESDRQAQMAGRGQQLSALQGGIGAYNTMGGFAGQMGDLGAQEQRMAFDRLGAMQGVGEQQRALRQAGMDIGYQDFLNQRNYPQEQMSWFGSILGGFPHQSDRSGSYSTFEQQPGLFQSMLGTGLGGIGLYQALQGGGQG